MDPPLALADVAGIGDALAITAARRTGLLNRKYALLLFFAGAAILTPPDVVTQIMMALPLMILYEISIIGARIFGKKKSTESDKSDD